MIYDKNKLRMMFYFAAAFIVIGAALIMKDQRVIGAILLCIGIAVFVIRVSISSLKMKVDFERKKRGLE
jgi:hypothetical protein